MIFPKCFCVWYLYGRRKYKYTISAWSRHCCWLLSVASTNENYNFWFLVYWVYISNKKIQFVFLPMWLNKWVNIKFIHINFASRKFWCSRHVPYGKFGPIKGMKDSLPRRKKQAKLDVSVTDPQTSHFSSDYPPILSAENRTPFYLLCQLSSRSFCQKNKTTNNNIMIMVWPWQSRRFSRRKKIFKLKHLYYLDIVMEWNVS